MSEWSKRIAEKLGGRRVQPERALRFHVFGDMRPLRWWDRIGWKPNDIDFVAHSGWVLLETDCEYDTGRATDGVPDYEAGKQGLMLTSNADLVSYEMPASMRVTLSRRDPYEKKVQEMVRVVTLRETPAFPLEAGQVDVGTLLWLDGTHGPLITLAELERALGELARRLHAP